MNIQTSEMLSQAAVARLLDITGPKLAKLVNEGKVIPDVKCGNKRFYSRDSAEKLRKEFCPCQ